MVDRISDLPDELLCRILSFLPTRFALTTTILSKRWTSSLVYSLSVLRFDYGTKKYSGAFSRFCYGVNTFMHHPRFSSNLHLKMFLLNCYYGTENLKSYSFVESSLEAAKQRSVEEVHLTLNYQRLKPAVFVSRTLVDLKLYRLHIRSDTSCVHLPLLKTLVLKFVYFHDLNDYVNFLSACPILEDLRTECIYLCNNMNHNENNAPMNSLTLCKLVRAEIGSADVLFNVVNKVEFLCITECLHQVVSFKAIPVFSNLIHVDLWFLHNSLNGWAGVIELLRHSPKLQILYIDKWKKIILLEEWERPISVIECVSSHLRSCTISNFNGLPDDLQFAAYILQNASLLQDMKIRLTPNVELILEKSQIIEQLSSCSRISPRCKLSFEWS